MSLYPWQHESWQQLQSYVVQKRVPQALLLNGTLGIGKQRLAEQFAYALLCEKPLLDGLSCGQCGSCLLIKAQTHPDFMVIEPEEDAKTKLEAGQANQLSMVQTLVSTTEIA